MVEWARYREDFPLVTECTYLNTASVSPSPSFLSDSFDSFVEDMARAGIDREWVAVAESCRNSLANLLDVNPDELHFVSNTTEGLNIVASSVQWEPGDEVIISDMNFPSNAFPWIALEEHGVTVRIAETVDGRLPMNRVTDLVSSETKLVSLPHVSMSTGYTVPIDQLSEYLANRDIALNLDGIHGFGCMIPDLTNIAGYSASLYKWLLGPFGMGILYTDREFASELIPSYVGYASVEQDMTPETVGYSPMSSEGGYPYTEFTLKAGPERLRYGHPNFPAIYCFKDILHYFETIGWDNITDRIHTLSGYLYDELAEIDHIRVLTERESRCGIITFQSDTGDPGRIEQALIEESIYVARRGKYLRASTHFYNNFEDVDRLVTALASM